MSKKSFDHLVKIMVIGDSSVGKSSIISRYTDNIYDSTFIPTIGVDFKLKTLNVNGKNIKIQIWDTAGQERFNAITFSFYRGADGMMLVYDITNTRSFDNLSKWLRNIEESSKEDVLKLIVGNKCDDEDLRVISTNHGQTLAEKNGIPFIETSAKENINIDKAFQELTERIIEKKFSSISTITENKPQSNNNNRFISLFPTVSFDTQKMNCC